MIISDAGDRALLVELGSSAEAQSLAAALLEAPPAGVSAIVPGLRSVLLEVDLMSPRSLEEVRDAVASRAADPERQLGGARTRVIPVAYGGEEGPDLVGTASALGLPVDEVVRRHSATELRVLFCGFAPGFGYLGELDEDLQVPRLATPRSHTAPGSVAIAGPMTGIYPADLPGGWRVIGRTPLRLFDADRDPPAYLAPGDRVRFEPVAAASVEWTAAGRAADDW